MSFWKTKTGEKHENTCITKFKRKEKMLSSFKQLEFRHPDDVRKPLI